MKKKYTEIKDFMDKYFNDYNAYAQDLETLQRVSDYWDIDIKATAFMKLEKGEYPIKRHNREAWQNFLIDGHRTVLDKMLAKEIVIDPKELKVVAIFEIAKYERQSKKQISSFDGIGLYRLKIDHQDCLKIISIDFFCGDPAGFVNLYKKN